jgi:hypothetical protein
MKQAVVFILDTNPSMNEPYPKQRQPSSLFSHGQQSGNNTMQPPSSDTATTTTATTRLECAKQFRLYKRN